MTTGTLRTIEVTAGYIRFLRKGAELAKGASKRAVQLCTGLRLEDGKGEAAALGVDAQAIIDLIDAREDPNLPVVLPETLMLAAQVGVGLEVGAVKKAREASEDALVDDVKPINKTGNQLDALLKNLGGEPLFDLDE